MKDILGTVGFLAIPLVVGGSMARLLAPVMERLLLSWGMGRRNYRGDTIPCGMGILLVVIGGGGLGLVGVWQGLDDWLHIGQIALTLAVACLIFGLLGFIDDRYGMRGIGGFRGHFHALLRERRLTTGVAKAVGGGIAALCLGWFIARTGLLSDPIDDGWPVVITRPELVLPLTLLNAALIALAANTINLLDTHPARALKVWGVLLALLLVPMRGWASPMVFLALFAPALVIGLRDQAAKAMLGDVGSNALGAVLGLACAWDLGTNAKIAVVILLVAFNVFCEKFSVSKILDNWHARRKTA